jgi:hypothetical protein
MKVHYLCLTCFSLSENDRHCHGRLPIRCDIYELVRWDGETAVTQPMPHILRDLRTRQQIFQQHTSQN